MTRWAALLPTYRLDGFGALERRKTGVGQTGVPPSSRPKNTRTAATVSPKTKPVLVSPGGKRGNTAWRFASE
jgi:hypothetical protein